MEIQIGEWFTLPRVEHDVFIRLTKQAQLGYSRNKGLFRITSLTEMNVLSSILKNVINEEVIFTIKCYICKNNAGCATCEYESQCDRKIMSNFCLCVECESKQEVVDVYAMMFVKELPNKEE